MEYAYDSHDRRTVVIEDAVMTRTLWSGADEVGEYDIGGLLKRRFIPDGSGAMDARLATINADSTVFWHHADHQGSLIATSNGAGQAAGFTNYSPHGEFGTGAGGVPMTAPPPGSPFGYTGRQWDAKARLYQSRARYYDPELGIFLSTDPIGTKDDPNLYMYVGLDPVNGTDPTGEDTLKVYDPNQAAGFGHVAAVHVAEDGAVTFANLTGDGRVQSNGEIRGAEGLKVEVDANGNVTEGGIAKIVGVMMQHWQTDPGEPGSGTQANVSVFRNADDTAGFQSQLAQERANISGQGPLGGFFTRDGRAYGLLNNNCSHLANRVVQAALPPEARGYYVGSGPSRMMAPNAQYSRETRYTTPRSYSWSQ
jgi:RHS repeat-associated protein